MVTEARLEKLRGVEGLETISALTHSQILALQQREVIQPELFDEHNIVEITDPDNPRERYLLCRNPLTAEKERDTRQRLIELSQQGLEKIADYKKKTTVEILGARVGKHLAKYKVGKFFDWKVEAACDGTENSRGHRVVWTLNEEKIAAEQRLDGCYIVRTDVAAGAMTAAEVVEDGMVVERWVQSDMLGLMQQLGAVDAPGVSGDDPVRPVPDGDTNSRPGTGCESDARCPAFRTTRGRRRGTPAHRRGWRVRRRETRPSRTRRRSCPRTTRPHARRSGTLRPAGSGS